GAICRLTDEKNIEELFFRCAGTFGLRKKVVSRKKLHVEFESVETIYGPIRIKTGSLNGEIMAMKVEFCDALQAAQSHNATIIEITDTAKAAFLQKRNTQ
ncbi:MAG TPA: DUF111 family protein, partial [Phycisphaerae bacterium]|nr:DUF111 family protein [Phycisphaerae bacterium]